nr:alpha/beta hydrolase [Mycobacterium gordonae]
MVFEAGGAGEATTDAFGGWLELWVASFATVLTYDRAGSGGSEGPPRRSVAEMADDLHGVIQQLHCATPAVVVGWSSGGLVAQMFALRHRDEVAGLVLLDPSAPVTESRLIELLGMAMAAGGLFIVGTAQLLRLPRTSMGRRVVRHMAPNDVTKSNLRWFYRYLDNHPWAGLQTARLVPRHAGYLREMKRALERVPLPDVPTRIIVPRSPTRRRAAYAKMDAANRALVKRFPRGELVFADGTSHSWLPVERPDVIVKAIRDVLRAGSH